MLSIGTVLNKEQFEKWLNSIKTLDMTGEWTKPDLSEGNHQRVACGFLWLPGRVTIVKSHTLSKRSRSFRMRKDSLRGGSAGGFGRPGVPCVCPRGSLRVSQPPSCRVGRLVSSCLSGLQIWL